MSNLRKKSCRLMVLMVLAQGAGTLEAGVGSLGKAFLTALLFLGGGDPMGPGTAPGAGVPMVPWVLPGVMAAGALAPDGRGGIIMDPEPGPLPFHGAHYLKHKKRLDTGTTEAPGGREGQTAPAPDTRFAEALDHYRQVTYPPGLFVRKDGSAIRAGEAIPALPELDPGYRGIPPELMPVDQQLAGYGILLLVSEVDWAIMQTLATLDQAPEEERPRILKEGLATMPPMRKILNRKVKTWRERFRKDLAAFEDRYPGFDVPTLLPAGTEPKPGDPEFRRLANALLFHGAGLKLLSDAWEHYTEWFEPVIQGREPGTARPTDQGRRKEPAPRTAGAATAGDVKAKTAIIAPEAGDGVKNEL